MKSWSQIIILNTIGDFCHDKDLDQGLRMDMNQSISNMHLVGCRQIARLTPTPIASQTDYLLSPTQTEHQVKGAFLLDVVVRQRSAILQLFACKDQALLVRWDTLLVLDLCLDIVYRI